MILPFLPEGAHAVLMNYQIGPGEPRRHGECEDARGRWRPSCGVTCATSTRCTTRSGERRTLREVSQATTRPCESTCLWTRPWRRCSHDLPCHACWCCLF